jgi:hypothetical protein
LRARPSPTPARASATRASSRAYSPEYVEKKEEFSEVRGSKPLLYAASTLDNRPWCRPPAPKRGELVAVVAPMCIKGLRLVTVQLPEKFSPIGVGTNRSSHIRLSRKSTSAQPWFNAREHPDPLPLLLPIIPTGGRCPSGAS